MNRPYTEQTPRDYNYKLTQKRPMTVKVIGRLFYKPKITKTALKASQTLNAAFTEF